ncbi:Hypothetical predicted protein [Pelobates cultripes]|uniref:Endonuclease/exonuclease/phosphatase domain-containing protein n=1 Tax=Pelobates cultripes TaxID=61616 RepID=A0AAD1S1U3_PELCU|nr:Hypothetical predicted protein [Pelobates cultripes]
MNRSPGGYIPALLRLWSNNVRGLNAPERRSHLLRSLWAARASVAFLQETNFRGLASPTLRDERFPLEYFTNHREAKRAILFTSHVPFICTDEKTDPLGRYLFLKGTIADTHLTPYKPRIPSNIASSPKP